ncbi:GIY-YIG nuclease family protein [Vibrio lentus]|nr:GIY-YIG nuclease family protein [Vibrio lentus]PMI56737.1 hypothetical protein BCU43_15015 [Vibrio lentus]
MNKLKKVALGKYLSLPSKQQAEISSLVFRDQGFSEFVKLHHIQNDKNSAYWFLIDQLAKSINLTTVYGSRNAYKTDYDEDRLNCIEQWVPSGVFTSSTHGSFEPLGDFIKCSSALAPSILKHHEKKMLESWKKINSSLGSHPMTNYDDYVAARLNYSLSLTDEQHVYFVLDHDSQIVKIGITKQVSSRLEAIKREYRTGELSLLALINGAGRAIEDKLHRKFASIQVKTKGKGKEWFHYNDEIKSFISEVNNQSGMLSFFHE